MAADNRPAERCVRVNRLRATPAEAQAALAADGITARAAGAASADGALDTPDALLVEGAPLETSAAFREGLVTPQSRGSQLAAVIAAGPFGAAHAGGRAADLCAAPGGKTSQLAALLAGWHVWPSTTSRRESTALRANLARLGAVDVEVVERDVLAMGGDARPVGALRSRPARRAVQRPGHAGLAAGAALAPASPRPGAPGRPAAPPARRRRRPGRPRRRADLLGVHADARRDARGRRGLPGRGTARWRTRSRQPGRVGARRSGRRLSRLPASSQRRLRADAALARRYDGFFVARLRRVE